MGVKSEAVTQGPRGRLLLVGFVLLVVALIAVAAVVLNKAAQRTLLEDVNSRPAHSDLHGGIAVDASGGAVNEGAAPRLALYVDLMSPESMALLAGAQPDIEALRAAGDVTVTYHLISVTDPGDAGASQRAAIAAAVVANYDPARFGPFLNALVARQSIEFGSFSDAQLETLGLEVGLAQDVVDAFTDGMYDDWVDAATEQMRRDTGSSTVPQVWLEDTALEGDLSVPGALRSAVEEAAAN